MKTLLIFIFLSVFSFMVFGQEEKSVKKEEAQASNESKAAEEKPAAEESKVAEEKPAAAEESKAVEEKPAAEEPKAVEEKPAAAEEPKAVEEKPAATEESGAAEEKPAAAEESKAVEEKPAATQESSGDAESGAIQAGIKYECDGGVSYILHEPGINDESHLCELDAGHTEISADWYAVHQSSFCREKLKEMIKLHNCVMKQ